MEQPRRDRTCPVCKEPALTVQLSREEREDGEQRLIMVQVRCTVCGYTRVLSAHEQS